VPTLIQDTDGALHGTSLANRCFFLLRLKYHLNHLQIDHFVMNENDFQKDLEVVNKELELAQVRLQVALG